MKVLAFKLVATLAVGVALAWPLLQSDGGVLDEVRQLGLGPTLGIAAGFLFAVWLYARTLVRSLELVPPPLRAATPRSVWWMFVLPYNFVEDFFIVHHLEKSLSAALPDHRARLGAVTGYGWCAAQIASLVPHRIAVVPSAVALVLWIIHWLNVSRANAQLMARAEAPRGTPSAPVATRP